MRFGDFYFTLGSPKITPSRYCATEQLCTCVREAGARLILDVAVYGTQRHSMAFWAPLTADSNLPFPIQMLAAHVATLFRPKKAYRTNVEKHLSELHFSETSPRKVCQQEDSHNRNGVFQPEPPARSKNFTSPHSLQTHRPDTCVPLSTIESVTR